MSLNRGCVFFDNDFPPDHAYVAVSRFRTRAGVYHYGRQRRTDWLPVGEEAEEEQTRRGYESMSSSSDEEHDTTDSEDGPEDMEADSKSDDRVQEYMCMESDSENDQEGMFGDDHGGGDEYNPNLQALFGVEHETMFGEDYSVRTDETSDLSARDGSA